MPRARPLGGVAAPMAAMTAMRSRASSGRCTSTGQRTCVVFVLEQVEDSDVKDGVGREGKVEGNGQVSLAAKMVHSKTFTGFHVLAYFNK